MQNGWKRLYLYYQELFNRATGNYLHHYLHIGLLPVLVARSNSVV